MRPVYFIFLPLLAYGITKDLTSWPRTKAQEFGCFLEKELQHKDSKFNCALQNYINQSNICTTPDLYSEGPEFPADSASIIHPSIDTIKLNWEHGELQGVTLTLKKIYSGPAARKLLGLPKEKMPLPPNISNIEVQKCKAKASCVIIQGFDHTNAGNVDCGSK